MRQAESFAWAVPTLAVTAQALLMTIALNNTLGIPARRFAAGSACLILLASLHLMAKHAFNFDLYESVVDRERERLGLPRVSRYSLLREVDSFPANLAFRERDWLARESAGKPLETRALVWLRSRLVVKIRALAVWAFVLGGMAVYDFGYFLRQFF